jgi:hypothetical protein
MGGRGSGGCVCNTSSKRKKTTTKSKTKKKSSFDKSNDAVKKENKKLVSDFNKLPLGSKIKSTQRDYGQSYTLKNVHGDRFFIGDKDGMPLSDGGRTLSEKTIMFSYKKDIIKPKKKGRK